jgi:hypothetical protein
MRSLDRLIVGLISTSEAAAFGTPDDSFVVAGVSVFVQPTAKRPSNRTTAIVNFDLIFSL